MYVRKINDLQFYGLNNFTMYRCYGNRQSLAARKRERLAMCFESCEEAKRRNEQQAVKFTGVRKSPVGNVENMAWDKQALLEEVNGYSSGDHVVNCSELARRYEVKNKNGEFAKNGGQIIQEYLKSQGVDIRRLKKRGADNLVPRVLSTLPSRCERTMTFMTDLDKAIHKSLYTNINLKPKQVVCLEAIYNNKDTIAILPTGYGKSLIYQLLPPLLSKRRSTLSDVEKAVVLVISPLNSLIDDQIKKVNDCSKIRAAFLSVSGHHMKDDNEIT